MYLAPWLVGLLINFLFLSLVVAVTVSKTGPSISAEALAMLN